MWKRLDDEDLLRAYQHEVPDQPLLVELLDRLRRERWAREVWAVVGMGHLRLTTAPYHHDRDRHGCVHLGARDGKVGISLHPAGLNMATDSASCSVEEAVAIVSKWMQKLLGGYSLHPLDEPTDDADPERPAFDLKQHVRVLERGGRNTTRQGVIDRAIWHHKHGRWTYYLRVGNKALSKRYYGVDLLSDEPGRCDGQDCCGP
jgi:hypothetical protein